MQHSDFILQQRSQLIKTEAYRLGFEFAGISEAGFLEEEAPRLERWLQQGMHGTMNYMERYFDKRLDPRLLVEGARSVISLSYNYYPEQVLYPHTQNESPQIARYAYGEDYHDVIKLKLKALLDFIRTHIGEINGRAFVDSAPVLEHAWARKSGLGWIGKNALLIHKNSGSYYFLAELICDLPLQADGAIKDYCGTCTRCIDACPTQAITPYWVDGSRCISYLTIELKDAIPAEFGGKTDNWVFGCDVCQEVCPWNRFARPHKEVAFEPNPQLQQMSHRDWVELTAEVFGRLFKKSAVRRTKFEGLQRNISFWQQHKRKKY